MKILPETLRLYALTESCTANVYAGHSASGAKLDSYIEELDVEFLQKVEIALQNGVSCLQFREKHLRPEHRLSRAIKLQKLCAAYRIPLIINDDIELAVKCKACGVHLGQEDMNIAEARRILDGKFSIGASAHSVAEAIAAYNCGADYLGCGAVFGSRTKSNVHNLSQAELHNICKAVPIPVVAIGGISQNNILDLRGSGIAGVAVVSAIFAADDTANSTRELKTLVETIVKS